MGAVSCYMFIYSSVIVADAINWNGFMHTTIQSYLCHSGILSVFSICFLWIELFVEKSFHELDSLNEKSPNIQHWASSRFSNVVYLRNDNDKKHFSFYVQRWSFSHCEYIIIFEIIIHICVEYAICDVASWMLIWCHVLIIVFWIRLTDASFSHRFIHLLFALCCCVFAKRYLTDQIQI